MTRRILFALPIVFFIAGSAFGRSMDSTNSNTIAEEEPKTLADNDDVWGGSLLSSDLRFLFHIYNDCAQKDFNSCLKMKLVTALDRAAKSRSNFEVSEGVSFVRVPPDSGDDSVEEKPLSEAELEASLPRGLQDKDNLLDELIMEKIMGFFKSYTLQFKLPTAEEFQRSLMEEARKKNKGGGGLILLPMMMFGSLLKVKLYGLAVLAGKALIIAKLALVLAGILALKKLIHHDDGHHHETAYHVVSSHGHGHGHGYGHESGRGIEDPHLLAYSGYAPA